MSPAVVSAGLFAFLALLPADASFEEGDYRWTGGAGDGQWNSAGNWQIYTNEEDWEVAGAPPNSVSATVYFNDDAAAAQAHTINLTTEVVIRRLIFDATSNRSFTLTRPEENETAALSIRETSNAIMVTANATQTLTLQVPTTLSSTGNPSFQNASSVGGMIVIDAPFDARRHDTNGLTQLSFTGAGTAETRLEVRQPISANRLTATAGIHLNAADPTATLIPTLAPRAAFKV